MNPVAERANRALVEMTRAMLNEANLFKGWWAEAIATTTYLNNRTLTSRLKDRTLFEA